MIQVPALPIERIDSEDASTVLASGPTFGIVTVRLLFLVGSAADGDRPGIAALAWEMSERGTSDLSRTAFHEALEATGAEWSMHVARRVTIVDLRVLREHLERALELVTDALLKPADAPEELAALIEEVDERVACDLEDPGRVVSRAVPVAMWDGTGWSIPIEGTRESREGIRADELHAHRTKILGSRLAIGIAADEPASVVSLVNAFVARIREAATDAPTMLARPEPGWGTSHFYPFPTEQGALTIVSDAADSGGSDWAAAGLHSTYFGEGFSSPLMEAVRSKHGLSYEVAWHVLPELERGLHVFRAYPESGNLARTLEVVRTCWEEHASVRPESEVFERAKASFLGSRLVALETAERRMTSALSLVRMGLPIERLWKLPAAVAELTVDEMVSASERFGWHTGRQVLIASGNESATPEQWGSTSLKLENRDPESLV
ncbi:MAG: zinc protease [Bradymonadia bacterium]